MMRRNSGLDTVTASSSKSPGANAKPSCWSVTAMLAVAIELATAIATGAQCIGSQVPVAVNLNDRKWSGSIRSGTAQLPARKQRHDGFGAARHGIAHCPDRATGKHMLRCMINRQTILACAFTPRCCNRQHELPG